MTKKQREDGNHQYEGWERGVGTAPTHWQHRGAASGSSDETAYVLERHSLWKPPREKQMTWIYYNSTLSLEIASIRTYKISTLSGFTRESEQVFMKKMLVIH